MIDRRRSAPLQLENAEKLESGQVGEGQFRAARSGRGQVRASQVRGVSGKGVSGQGESGQGESGGGAADPCSDPLRDVTCSQVTDA